MNERNSDRTEPDPAFAAALAGLPVGQRALLDAFLFDRTVDAPRPVILERGLGLSCRRDSVDVALDDIGEIPGGEDERIPAIVFRMLLWKRTSTTRDEYKLMMDNRAGRSVFFDGMRESFAVRDTLWRRREAEIVAAQAQGE